ncbi:MAG TPA: rhodanese-like domain-containing protein [Azospirillaceae bacterium]|nr:rhodanese-like domain-containing protein [Azospirillaceae bacterium]
MEQDIGWIIVAAASVMALPLIRRALSPATGITPDALKRRLDAGEDMLVLDVRTPDEFAGGHIGEAVNVALPELAQRLPNLKSHLADHGETSVVVVCQSGPRAHHAARLLRAAGLRKVAIMTGGMNGWRRAGLSV